MNLYIDFSIFARIRIFALAFVYLFVFVLQRIHGLINTIKYRSK